MTRAPSGKGRAGFTFVEASIALLVAVLLVTVAARSLIMVFRADRAAARQLEGRLLLQRAATARYLGTPLEDRPEDWPPGWSVQSEPLQTGSGPEAARWTMIRCFAESSAISAAFREP